MFPETSAKTIEANVNDNCWFTFQLQSSHVMERYGNWHCIVPYSFQENGYTYVHLVAISLSYKNRKREKKNHIGINYGR